MPKQLYHCLCIERGASTYKPPFLNIFNSSNLDTNLLLVFQFSFGSIQFREDIRTNNGFYTLTTAYTSDCGLVYFIYGCK